MFRTADSRVRLQTRFSQALAVSAIAAISFAAHADQPVSPTTTSNGMDAGIDLVRERMEEIIVYAPRDQMNVADQALLADPLRERIMEEIRLLNVLDEEREWRLETAKLEIKPPRIRVGYDPRNDERAAPLLMTNVLPLDLMQPATVFSVDF